MNQIRVIAPYWDDESATWVFDEHDYGLIKEPFVLGVPQMIDNLVKDIDNAHQGFRLLFSHQPFPSFDKVLTRVSEDMGGWWYKDAEDRKGWLCPAMFHYFVKAPLNIYVKAESVQ